MLTWVPAELQSTSTCTGQLAIARSQQPPQAPRPTVHRPIAKVLAQGRAPRSASQKGKQVALFWLLGNHFVSLGGRRRELRADSVQCLEECRRR